MKRLFFARNKLAASLLEILIATSLIALVVGLGFVVLIRGARNLRLNELAAEAQKSGLLLMSKIHGELQSTRSTLIGAQPDGIVFASPFKADGTTEYDSEDKGILFQFWVCYQYQQTQQTVTRRLLAISPASATPGGVPLPLAFNAARGHLIADHVGQFKLTQVSTAPPLWELDVIMGSMTDSSSYGVELQTQVGPRN